MSVRGQLQLGWAVATSSKWCTLLFHLYTDPLHAKHSDTACVDSVLHVSCGAAVQSVFATCGDGHKHGRSAIQPYSTDSLIPRLPAEQSWEPGARLLHCQKAIVALCTSCGKLARPLPQCSNLASSCVKCKGPTVRYCTRIKILTPNSTELSALYLLFVGWRFQAWPLDADRTVHSRTAQC